MSPIKETNFFAYEGQQARFPWPWRRERNAFPVTSLEAYEDLFREAGNARAIGEASPLYMSSPVAAENIRRHLPGARLIASLRNPADRAFSGYLMHLRHARAWRAPQQAFTPGAFYVKVSFLYENLRRYYDRFPAEQIMVILSEDLARDTVGVARKVYRFLQVDTSFSPDLTAKHNVGSVPRSKVLNAILTDPLLRSVLEPVVPPRIRGWAAGLWKRNLTRAPEFPPELRRQLVQYFREDILKVQDLIQRDLSTWLEE
jgi:hypothetical protein